MYNWKRRLMSLALAAAVSCTALEFFDVHADEIKYRRSGICDDDSRNRFFID